MTGLGALRRPDGRPHRPAEGPRPRTSASAATSGWRTPRATARACALMEVAQRHGFPIVTFLDSPGAYPGVAAEQHGQGGAIARSQALMARLTRPARLVHHRRGELGRCDRDRARRPRADAGERDLQRDLTRGLRGDPLARRRREGEGCGRAQARRGALPRAGRDRRDRPGAAGRRAPESGRSRPAARTGARPDPRRAVAAVPGGELRAQRRERYRRMGIYTARTTETALRSGS